MSDEPRQRVVRVAGARRARLTPVAGSDPSPEVKDRPDAVAPASSNDTGPNDARLRQDVPPHY
ncbi:hypothetical protein ACWGJP_15295 [Microbacterium sp. NPDC055903]